MRVPLLLCLAGAVAACSRPEPTTAPASEPVPAAVASPAESMSRNAIASAERLAGEYRIAGVDGRDINLPYGITASISGDRIEVQADCVRLAWSYRFEGARLVTRGTPVAGCRRGLTPEEEGVRAAFEAAEAVRRLPSNGIEFSGGRRSVLLFSQ